MTTYSRIIAILGELGYVSDEVKDQVEEIIIAVCDHPLSHEESAEEVDSTRTNEGSSLDHG